MRGVVIKLLSFGLLCGLGAGCMPSATDVAPPPGSAEPVLSAGKAKRKDGASNPEQDTILNALEESRTAFNKRSGQIRSDSQPAEVSRAFRDYQTDLQNIDVARAPVEFRGAWGRYVKSWTDLTTALDRLPSAYEDVQFMDALQQLFRGNTEKGKLLGGDVMAAVKKVNQQFRQIYAAAQNYGVVTED